MLEQSSAAGIFSLDDLVDETSSSHIVLAPVLDGWQMPENVFAGPSASLSRKRAHPLPRESNINANP
jgi:hypothetical protein